MKKRPNRDLKRSRIPRNESDRQGKARDLNRAPASHGRFVMGRNVLLELLRRSPDRIKKVYLLGSRDADESRRELIRDIGAHGIEISEVDGATLTKLVGSDRHQGFVALVSERQPLDFQLLLRELSEERPRLIVILDSILDPQNLGALLRACECFSVDGVILCSNRGCGITPVVSKASVGASELVALCSVPNLVNAIQKLKDAGAWVVVSDCGPSAQPLTSFKFPEKCVLVLGSEGEGVHRLLLDRADFRLKIPIFGAIDSLNVSQACAVLLAKFREQFLPG